MTIYLYRKKSINVLLNVNIASPAELRSAISHPEAQFHTTAKIRKIQCGETKLQPNKPSKEQSS